ncbi:MAG: LPS export ABC transporter permease LptF [Magnetospirillum sp.]|nr:LPS export ABC transporter permease LptF [Magnetospirillum sp.]
MTTVTRYVLRQLTVGMIFVSAALACVLWLTQSLRFVEMIVNKGLSIGTFLLLTLLLMPSFLVVILPISLFAVVLFTYNKLNADRELVVLRASGLSHWALARPALILALVATVVGWLLTLWGIPGAVRSFREMQWSIRNDITSVLLQEGVFNKFGEGLTIYVRERNASGELLGILVHDKRTLARPVTVMAERGALVYTENGPRVLMVNGNRQQVTMGSGRLSVLYFDSYTIDFDAANDPKEKRFRDQREWTNIDLAHADERELGSSEYRRAIVELHQRITSPLYNLGFAMIALASLLPSGFNRRGQIREITIAVTAMVAAEAAALGAANLSTAKLIFVPTMYLMALLPIVAGTWLLLGRKPFRRRRPPSPFAAT